MSTPLDESYAAASHARSVPPPTALPDGVTAVPVPLAGSPLTSIIVYTIETSAGRVLVDAGYRHRSCWEAFVAALGTVGQRPEEICAVLLTHNHPDHVGFADRVRSVSGAEVVMHAGDDFATQDDVRGGFLRQLRGALAATGAPVEVQDEMYAAGVRVAHHDEDLVLDRVLDTDTDLVYGDTVVRAVPTPGHTYGHTVYLLPDAGVVLTGDTLMPEGPVQLAIPSLPGDDPARDLLRSLRLVADLEPAWAAPAHQYPYTGVAERARALVVHHEAEVERVAVLAETRETAWEVAPLLDWPKPWAEMGVGTRRFALVHTLGLLRAARRPASSEASGTGGAGH
jgi:glyoxylase-like metal-dependent hydrolase (beta-lactamase superfamily II)